MRVAHKLRAAPIMKIKNIQAFLAGPKPKKMLRAVYDCSPDQEGDLAFNKGDMIELVSEEPGNGWVTGRVRGVQGILPLNYVERL